MKLNILKENLASLNFSDENFLIVKAHILKANNDMRYFDEGDKPVIEKILEEDLFSSEAMNSFIGKTVTLDHPVERLNTKNLTKYKKGTIIGVEKNQDYLTATIQVEEKEIIDYLVEMYQNSKPLEVSAGYFATTEQLDSEKFIQRNIKGNHLAILPYGMRGRAGSEVKLIYNRDGGISMQQKFKTNVGELTADEMILKLNEFQTLDASNQAKLTELESFKAVAETEKVTLEEKINKITSEKEAIQEKFNKLEANVSLQELKEKVNSFIEVTDEMKERDIKEKLILKVNKKFISEGKSAEAINATFDFALETLLLAKDKDTELSLVENSSTSTEEKEKIISGDEKFKQFRKYGGK